MNEHLISLYIDNELTLKEKIDFIKSVEEESGFSDEALALLDQEQRLTRALASERGRVRVAVPAREDKGSFLWRLRPVSALAGFAFGCCLLLLLPGLRQDHIPQAPGAATPYRFVLYLPDARDASVIGTFSDWAPLPMQQMGATGYWTLNMELPPGEYRYSYLIGDHTRMYDPTIPDREEDDFGGENSILTIGEKI